MTKTNNDPLEWYKLKQKLKRRKPENLDPDVPAHDEDLEYHIDDVMRTLQKAKLKRRDNETKKQ